MTNQVHLYVIETNPERANSLGDEVSRLPHVTVVQNYPDAVAASGFAPMPGPNEQFLGGHAVMLVGYDDSQTAFIVRNSWGSSWGQAGYFTLPYEYVCDPNLASDFWTVKTTA